MKIIAGEKRGHALATPSGDATRPTLSRVRESVFSILGAGVIDASVADLFAGAGTLGLEALSRGATHCTFVENAPAALKTLLSNVGKLQFEGVSTVVRGSATAWAESADLSSITILFVDPPYHLGLAQKTLEALAANPTLPPDLVLVLQCGKRDEINAPSTGLNLFRTEKYGETIVYFFSSNRNSDVR